MEETIREDRKIKIIDDAGMKGIENLHDNLKNMNYKVMRKDNKLIVDGVILEYVKEEDVKEDDRVMRVNNGNYMEILNVVDDTMMGEIMNDWNIN